MKKISFETFLTALVLCVGFVGLTYEWWNVIQTKQAAEPSFDSRFYAGTAEKQKMPMGMGKEGICEPFIMPKVRFSSNIYSVCGQKIKNISTVKESNANTTIQVPIEANTEVMFSFTPEITPNSKAVVALFTQEYQNGKIIKKEARIDWKKELLVVEDAEKGRVFVKTLNKTTKKVGIGIANGQFVFALENDIIPTQQTAYTNGMLFAYLPEKNDILDHITIETENQ